MPGRLGPRFAIETLFLIALAVGAAYADLDAEWIVLIMAAGWLVVALLELTAERIWAAVPPWRRPNYYSSAVVAPPEPAPLPDAEPEAGEPERAPEPEPQAEPEPEPEPQPPRLEPLEPRPKRRWFRRRADVEPAEAPPPALPKHVRLLPQPAPAH